MTDPMPGAPERPADADSYEDAYREAGRTPGSWADYCHRLAIWSRDRLAWTGLVERPAATERPGHGGHPDAAIGPMGGWPAPHGLPSRVSGAEADRVERVREGRFGWLGALRYSSTIRGDAFAAGGLLTLAVVLLGMSVRTLVGLGAAEPSVGGAIGGLVLTALVAVPGARAASRLVCGLGASVRPDAADATEAEQRWRCGACKEADRAWADGDRDVTPTAVGEWDIPARVRGVGSELNERTRPDAEATTITDEAGATAPNSSSETVADGGETPIAFAAAVGPARRDDPEHDADGGGDE
ncbi:hypothetical protein [Haloglomus halophilum]|uniref:hypothetical protein n=1 Tax=Haloglomus halophilum TaxID=2962672 RepID=UPI0020C959AF|nr:hypothetical protein [Haloglomus halophilum]